jgi:predicted 3-demethylubiquinone-9 3-methyltransferase (glyoxalase superfamily)
MPTPGTPKIGTCLWFDRNAEEAVNFYVSLFADSRIVSVTRYGKTGPGPEGSVLTITFELAGREFVALNGGPHFRFNEAISMFVQCDTQAEIDRLWETLLEGGEAQQCGWLKDRFGLSWQILPSSMDRMLRDPDPKRSERVMTAMLQMVKLDIAQLERAYNSN